MMTFLFFRDFEKKKQTSITFVITERELSNQVYVNAILTNISLDYKILKFASTTLGKFAPCQF